MTTWKFNVSDDHRSLCKELFGRLPRPIKTSIVRIELDRSSIQFIGEAVGLPSTVEMLLIGDINRLQLLAFAQQLIAIIAEQDSSLVKKDRIVMTAKAIRGAQS